MQITLHHWIKREKQLYWQSRRWLTASTIVTVISLSSSLTDLAFSLMSLFFIFSEISVQREPPAECCYLFVYSYLHFFGVCFAFQRSVIFKLTFWTNGCRVFVIYEISITYYNRYYRTLWYLSSFSFFLRFEILGSTICYHFRLALLSASLLRTYLQNLKSYRDYN